MTPLNTTKTDLGESRVRVDVEVPADAVEREVADAAGVIGRDLKIPGFRKGKVPAQVVLRQVRSCRGASTRRSGAALSDWYEQAIREAGVAPVGDPKIDVSELPEKGEPLSFNFEVGVRPEAKLGEWRGLEVERAEPVATDEEVQTELDRLRESLASLEIVERAAAEGDFVVIDFVGNVDGEPFEGGEARGFLLELGSGRLIEGFETQLEGAAAERGAHRRGDLPRGLPGRASRRQGRDLRRDRQGGQGEAAARARRRLRDRGRRLRLARRAARGHRVERIGEQGTANVDATSARPSSTPSWPTATIEIPHDLVHAKAHEMWHQTSHRLQQQGLDPAQYLQMINKTSEELIVESEPDAEQALRREAALAAIVEAEEIEVGDDELLEVLREASTEPGKQPPSDKACSAR